MFGLTSWSSCSFVFFGFNSLFEIFLFSGFVTSLTFVGFAVAIDNGMMGRLARACLSVGGARAQRHHRHVEPNLECRAWSLAPAVTPGRRNHVVVSCTTFCRPNLDFITCSSRVPEHQSTRHAFSKVRTPHPPIWLPINVDIKEIKIWKKNLTLNSFHTKLILNINVLKIKKTIYFFQLISLRGPLLRHEIHSLPSTV